MKKAILSALVLLSFTGCAQRLQQRPKPADAAKVEVKDEKKKVEGPAADQTLPKITVTGDGVAAQEQQQTQTQAQQQTQQQQQQNQPASVTVPALDIPKASCNVEFQPVSEIEGAEFMKTVAGLWIEGGVNEIRNVVPSTDTSKLTRSAIQFGQKVEEIVISKVTFKQAEAPAPGQSPLVIATNEKLAQAISYRVSSDINGFRLVEVSTSQAATAKMKCSTFALRLESASAKVHDILHVIGPIQEQSLKAEDFIGSGKQNKFSRSN